MDLAMDLGFVGGIKWLMSRIKSANSRLVRLIK